LTVSANSSHRLTTPQRTPPDTRATRGDLARFCGSAARRRSHRASTREPPQEIARISLNSFLLSVGAASRLGPWPST
jgi:hypothetical protein